MTIKNLSVNRLIVYFSLLMFTTLQSCEKTKDTSAEVGEATVTISLAGVEYDDSIEETVSARNTLTNGQTKMSTNSSSNNTNNDEPFAVVPFDENYSIYATLKQETTEVNQRLLSSSSSNKGAIVRSPLASGVRYRLLVFGPTGAYITQRDYAYGSESSATALNLDGGTTYTFVAYSFNTTATIPAFNLSTSSSTLANTSLTNLKGDFLYFKNTVQVATGTNNLSVVLKHMFAEITTILSVGSTTSSIQGFFYNTNAISYIRSG